MDSLPDRGALVAERLGFVTEDDLIALTKTSPVTVEAWRKRGEWPPVVRAGNAYLYPLDGLQKWLHARVRTQKWQHAAANATAAL